MKLAEVVVASMLASVVLLVLTLAGISASRTLRHGSRQSEVQRNGLLVARRLGEAIRNAHPDSLSAAADGSYVFCLSALSQSGEIGYTEFGQTLWQAWQCFYHDPERREIRLFQRDITPHWQPQLSSPPLLKSSQHPRVARLVERLQCRVDEARSLLNVTVETKDEAYRTVLSTSFSVPASAE